MAGSTPQAPSFIVKLKDDIRREPRKAAVLAVLFVVAAVMIGRQLIAPAMTRSADAAATLAPVPPAGPGELDESAEPGTDHPRAAPDYRIVRDIFLPNPSVFPLPRVKEALEQPTVLAKEPGPTEEELRAKAAALERARRQAVERAVQAEAGGLRLQSILAGRFRTAIINGQLVRAGGWIGGFRVVEVNSQDCVLEKDDVRVKLAMRLQ